MNYKEFYVDPSGSNQNGGSTSAAAAIYTSADTSVILGDLVTIVDNTGNNWTGVSVDDYVAFNPSGTTYEYRRITAVAPGGDATKITVHANCTVAANRQSKVGGAWLTMQVAAAAVTTLFTDTNSYPPRVNIKGGSDYSADTAMIPNNASTTVPITFEGYTTTIGDGGMANFFTTTNNLPVNISGTKQYLVFKNIYFKTTVSSANFALIYSNAGGLYNKWINCKFERTANTASLFDTAQYQTFISCHFVWGSSNNGVAGYYSNTFLGCYFYGSNSTGSGILCRSSYVSHCIFVGNGTRVGYGVNLSQNYDGKSVDHCTFYNLARGINFRYFNINITNNIFSSCNYGIYSTDVVTVGGWRNAFYASNTADTLNVVDRVDPTNIALSADPFTNAAGNDFSLNNTASGGADCRAAGFPGAMQTGGTGYPDVGALQHQPQFPAITDVKSGVTYDDGNYTGTYSASGEHSYISIG